jgi:hypothetical protein
MMVRAPNGWRWRNDGFELRNQQTLPLWPNSSNSRSPSAIPRNQIRAGSRFFTDPHSATSVVLLSSARKA